MTLERERLIGASVALRTPTNLTPSFLSSAPHETFPDTPFPLKQPSKRIQASRQLRGPTIRAHEISWLTSSGQSVGKK